MSIRLRVALAGPVVAGLLGCYHATITTGLTPSTETVEKSFASGWIYGLVPPSTVETAAKCKTGVAKVETKLSFVNQLVNFITLGIYTPMHITVTCAARSSADANTPRPDFAVALADGAEVVQSTLQAAAAKSLATSLPAYIAIW